MCHLIGDYVLQTDFIAKTKGSNMYHMFVHCVLYCLPFILVLPMWQVTVIFLLHFPTDTAKARYNKISYLEDQCIHYIVLLFLLIVNTI